MLSNIKISDYYSIFTMIPISKNTSKNLENYERKDMKNFYKEKFLITLENKLSNLFINNTLSVYELFDKFVAIFADEGNDFAPRKKQLVKKKNFDHNHGKKFGR